jgi:hypothetical protein
VIARRDGIWQEWRADGLRVYMKQSTLFVRGAGWEANATRHPIYNHVAGPSTWRLDFSLRPLDGATGFEGAHGRASATCHPHGILGQSWDGDGAPRDGAVDDYKYRADAPIVTTKAMAEGAIEGVGGDYALPSGRPFATDFKFSRFARAADSACAMRNVSALPSAPKGTLPRVSQRKASADPPRIGVAGSRDDPLYFR